MVGLLGHLVVGWPAASMSTWPGSPGAVRRLADAIEDPATTFRVEVGDDARALLGACRSLDDAQFEAAVRDLLGITW